MVRSGLAVDDASHAYERLLAVNSTAPNGETAIKSFLEPYRASKEILENGVTALSRLPDPDLSISPVPNSIETLELLNTHQLAIVTVGREELQFYKLKKAGFDLSLFSKIVVIREKNKRMCYDGLLKEFRMAPYETIVVGDRISIDLTPAKELGCHTVHLLRGRGLAMHPSGSLEDVDYVIQEFEALVGIVSQTENLKAGK